MSDPTRFFRHYKNKPYRYLGVARHSETLEEMALYETLYENKLGTLWVRPKGMFFEDVEIEGVKRPRFEKIEFRFRADAEVPAAALAQLRELYRAGFGQELDETKFRGRLGAHRRVLLVSAYEADRLVGFKLGFAQSEKLFYSWIGAVDPQYRGLGLASALMEHQHRWCTEQGFSEIETRTHNRFAEMLRLNLKFGFRISGLLQDAADDPKIILRKKLN